MHLFHFLHGKNPAGELRQIAVVEELGQELLVTCQQGIGRFEQLMKKLLCRLMRDPNVEACFDIAANNFRYLDFRIEKAKRSKLLAKPSRLTFDPLWFLIS